MQKVDRFLFVLMAQIRIPEGVVLVASSFSPERS